MQVHDLSRASRPRGTAVHTERSPLAEHRRHDPVDGPIPRDFGQERRQPLVGQRVLGELLQDRGRDGGDVGADAREHLYSHDLGLTRVRGLMAREALQQAKALTARQGGTQAGTADSEQPPAG